MASMLKEAKDLRDLRESYRSIRTTVAGDTRFSAQAIFFLAERLVAIEKLLEAQVRLQETKAKPKRPLSEWQRFFAAGMKAGHSPVEIGKAWRAR